MAAENTNGAVQPQQRTEPIENVRAGPWRYSYLPELDKRALTNSIAARGQLKPIYVRSAGSKSFEILEGHRILEALLTLQRKEAWIFSFGKLSDADASLLCVELRYNYGDYSRHRSLEMAEFSQLQELTTSFSRELISSRIPLGSPTPHEQVQRWLAKAVGPGRRKLNPRKGELLEKLRHLKGARLAIWIAYCLRADANGRARLSRQELTRLTGYGKKSISGARSWLSRNGWLVSETFRQPRISTRGLRKGNKGAFTETAYTPMIPSDRS